MESKNANAGQYQGTFINGKAQIIELLQSLSTEEKSRILKIIKIKNPQLALELSQESFSFNQIEKVSDHEIKLLFNYIEPSIFGVALKGVSIGLQKKILKLATREYAEEAYSLMISPIKDESNVRKKAQNKILSILSGILSRKN